MRAKVINLVRSPDRRTHMESQLSALGLDYDFVEAVDGHQLRLPDPELVDPTLSRELGFRPGFLGCTLSHIRAYESVIAEDLDRALILEDDVLLPDDVATLAECVGQRMTGPEVVLLNFHTERPCKLVRTGSIDLPHRRQLLRPESAEQLTSTAAYVVTREACVRMVEVNRPVSILADQWGAWKKSAAVEQVRCVVPLAVRKEFRFLSVVSHYPPASLRGVLQRTARRRVPLMYEVLALRRRSIERRWSRLEFIDEPPASCGSGSRRFEPEANEPAAGWGGPLLP